MNILFSTNSAFIIPTSVMLYSACVCHPDTPIDFYLAYHNLTAKDIDRLNTIVTSFPEKRMILLDVGDEFEKTVKAKEQYSHETYYRILAVNLLPDSVHRILYLDGDMLIRKNLQELYDTVLDATCPFVVCEDIHLDIRDYQYIKDGIHMPRTSRYFNAGMLLMNIDYLRQMRSTGYIIDAFVREARIYTCPDQDILNILYADKVKFVPWTLYNLPPMHWNLDVNELLLGRIKYASYPELFNQPKEYINVTEQLKKHAYIIHYLGNLLKPWKYRNGVFYEDLALYSDLWFDCEKEMYQQIPTLEHLI
ncbi:MAG: glycosyltransferase family 8 protein [Lachnospiraceae bacterium]|nr:glycosyltransferase family 8 protein [Lachnospiraceae bacterium]